MARNNRPRRQFEWARAVGFNTGQVDAAEGVAFGSIDLLADARARWGDAVFRGATVMAVKGWIRPFVPPGTRVSGTTAIRVASAHDIAEANVNETPFNNGLYEDWMGYFPYDYDPGPDLASPSVPATWNAAASVWGVDLQSSRKLEELGVSLGMFYEHSPVDGPVESFTNLDYHLSIGLKLA